MPDTKLQHWALFRSGSGDLANKLATAPHNPGVQSDVPPTEPPSTFRRFT